MDESTLQSAIDEGRRIDQEVVSHADALKAADTAYDLESNEPERTATQEELALLEQAVEAGESLNRLQARQDSLEWELRAAMGASARNRWSAFSQRSQEAAPIRRKGTSGKSP